MLGGLLLLAVLASSYGLPMRGDFFLPRHAPPDANGRPRDIPHEGVTHRHAPGSGENGFWPAADGETRKNANAQDSAPDDGRKPDSGSFGDDKGHPGGKGDGSGPGGSQGGDSHGDHGQRAGLPGGEGHGGGVYYTAGDTPPGTGDPAGPQDGSPGPDASRNSPHDTPGNPFDDPPGDPSDNPPGNPPSGEPPPFFDIGCQSCDPTGPSHDGFPQEYLPPSGDEAKGVTAAVPESSSLMLFAPGLLTFAAARRRRGLPQGGAVSNGSRSRALNSPCTHGLPARFGNVL